MVARRRHPASSSVALCRAWPPSCCLAGQQAPARATADTAGHQGQKLLPKATKAAEAAKSARAAVPKAQSQPPYGPVQQQEVDVSTADVDNWRCEEHH